MFTDEQKRQNEKSKYRTTKELEQFRVWLNYEERRQFDIKYAEHEAARIDAAK